MSFDGIRKTKGLIRRAAHTVIASAVVVTSAFPAAANETYFFRYNAPVSWTPGSGGEDTGGDEYAAGNDVTVFFTGVMGQQFSKAIAVKTTEVADWRLASGTIQPGLSVDAGTGVVSGTPSGKEKAYKATLIGYNVKGERIARANVTFTFHNPVGQPQEFTFYGHTDKYMYRQVPAVVNVSRWEALADLPDDFKTQGRFLGGTPSKEYQTGLAFIGYDFADKEVAFASGDLIVQDQPVIAQIPDQQRHPTKTFAVYPSVQYKVGEITYRLVALDGKPSSLNINSKTGKVSGTIPTFNTALRFRVEALDIDGTTGTSNVFTLSTPAPDSDISKMKDQFGVVGQEYSLAIAGKDLSGDENWQVTAGTLPDGISLDPETGELSGKPLTAQVKEGIVISVVTSDGGRGETPPFKFTVKPEAIDIAFNPVNVRTGRLFKSDGPTLKTGIVNPYSFNAVSDVEVNDAIDVDYAHALVSGSVDTAGNYDVPFNFVNGDGEEKTFTQAINVFDPLALAYDETVTVYRRTAANVLPTNQQGIVGNASYVLNGEALPEGLTLDSHTGAITGVPKTMQGAADVSVLVTDGSGESVSSNAFDIEVQDRPAVEVAVAPVEVERFVDNAVVAAVASNTFDGVTYTLEEGNLPDGLSLDEDGYISGTTEEPTGICNGFRIRATDGEGYSKLSGEFSITVVQPKDLKPLNNGANDATAQWTAGIQFSLALPRPSNAFGNVTYSLQGLPADVAVVGDHLEGKINNVGTYTYSMTLTDAANRSLFGTYTLTIIKPMTAVLDGPGKRLGSDPDDVFFDVPRRADAKIAPVIKNGIEPLAYDFTGTLPDGLHYADGIVSGNAITENETGDMTLTITDAVGTKVTLSASLKVLERLPIDLSYSIPEPAGLVGQGMSPIKPTAVNAIGAVTYKLTGNLPDGVSFDQTTGYFYGTPIKDGWSEDLWVNVKDSDVFAPSSDNYGPFKLGISYSGLPSLSGKTVFTVRAGKPFERTIEVTNVTSPLLFGTVTLQPLPYGLTLGSASGKIAGTFASEGKYQVGTIAVVDAFNRSKQTDVSFTAVGPLTIAAPTTTAFPQYSAVNAVPVATNAIGQTKYELISGSLPDGLSINTSTGAIGGSTAVKGTFGNLIVRATDSTGDSAQTAAFSLTIGDRLPLTMDTPESYNITANVYAKIYMPVKNAVGNVTFAQSGDLPRGIILRDGGGLIWGAATVIGTYPITMTVTDSVGATVTKKFNLVIDANGKPIGLTVYDFTTKKGYPIKTDQPLSSNTVGDVRFWADETLADKGLEIDSKTGVITGTATDIMEFSPNVNITDDSNRVTSKTINIRVVPNLAIDAPERIDLFVNKRIYPYIYLNAENATGTLDWTIEGTLPKGVAFGKTTHRFTGTPTEIGTFDLTVRLREKTGFMQTSVANIKMVVVGNGLPPGVSLTPVSTGYADTTKTTLTPTYTNAKVGDVLTLAPDSKPLPPSVTITKNASGVYVLTKTAFNAKVGDQLTFPGIKLRVTDLEGVTGDSAPFTIIIRSNLVYGNVAVSARANAPITVKTPVSTAGRASGTLEYSLTNDFSNGSLTIDKTTGVITGTISKSGSVRVNVSDMVDGALVRNTYFYTAFTLLPFTLTAPDTMGSYMGMAFPSYSTTIANGVEGGVFTTTGSVPPGLSIDPTKGTMSGTPTTVGTYRFNIVFTDQYGTASKAVTAYIDPSAAAGEGYKYIRITPLNNKGYLHIWNYSINGASGYSMMHVIPAGTGTFTSDMKASLLGKSHSAVNLPSNSYQEYNLPVPVAKGSVTFGAHGSANTAVQITASVDGQSWDDLGTRTLDELVASSYSVPFLWVPKAPTVVDFKLVNSATTQSIALYSATVPTITTTARLSSTNAVYTGVTTWTRLSGTLPPGVKATPSADGSVLVYEGYPTATGTFNNIVWRATDANGNTATSAAVTFTVTTGAAMSVTRSPSSGIQSVVSGSGSATAKLTINNIPYGQSNSALVWTYDTSKVPPDMAATVSGNVLSFSGKSYAPGVYYVPVTIKEPKANTTINTSMEIQVTSVFDVVGSKAGTVNLKVGVSSSLPGWGARDSGNVGYALSKVAVKPGTTAPPGITAARVNALKTNDGAIFTGVATTPGTYKARLLLTSSNGTVVQTPEITFVVEP